MSVKQSLSLFLSLREEDSGWEYLDLKKTNKQE
jgi:hypothetical protein